MGKSAGIGWLADLIAPTTVEAGAPFQKAVARLAVD